MLKRISRKTSAYGRRPKTKTSRTRPGCLRLSSSPLGARKARSATRERLEGSAYSCSFVSLREPSRLELQKILTKLFKTSRGLSDP